MRKLTLLTLPFIFIVMSITVSAQTSGTVTVSSGPLSLIIPESNTFPAPANVPGVNNIIFIDGIPTCATITGIRVQLNIAHPWIGDAVIALKAPNGNTLNLDYLITGTFGNGTAFTNTIVSSAGSNPLSSGSGTYTGTFRPDAFLSGSWGPTGPNGFAANVNTFSSLYSIPNGSWTLALYDAFSGDQGSLTSWSISIDYTVSEFTTQKIYVNDGSSTGDVFTTNPGNDLNSGTSSSPYLTIQKAVTMANCYDTIFVDAGSYTNSTLSVNLTKPVTILGSNYLISPNDAINPLVYNTARNKESDITNFLLNIASPNINIEGLLFTTLNSQILLGGSTTDYDNIKIKKNQFSFRINSSSIALSGRPQMPLTTTNYLIDDNRFVKENTGIGMTLNLNAIDQLIVSNNVFTVLATASPTVQTGMVIGMNFRTDNVTISNNHAYRYGTFISSVNAKRLTITGNKTFENDRFMGVNIVFSDPSETTVSDNIITNDKTPNTSISYVRTNGTGVSSPNIFRAERNSITIDGTGLARTPGALIAPTITNSPNTELIIQENKLRYTGDFSSRVIQNPFKAAIRLWQGPKNSTIARNEIIFDGTNYGNVAFDTLTGIAIYHSTLPAGASFSISNNKVSGFTHSISVIENPTNIYGKLPAGTIVNINNNSLSDALLAINNGTTGQTVNATCNWYGTSASQNILNKVTPSTVNYTPWLSNGTDNDAATGFQPVTNSCTGVPVDADILLVTNVTCNGAANGAIHALAEEGLAPFTYAWSKDGIDGFSTLEDITNLSPGDYKLIVTDANGSVDSVFASITEPDILTVVASGTNNLCFGASAGTATVVSEGGTTPYTYLWSNGETTETINNLTAGNYSVTVTDANGCIANSNYEVTQPAQLVAVITNISTACSNIASVGATGGTGAYTYSWSNGTTGTSISSVPVGTYSVTVTDENGCTDTESITLSVNNAFNPSASVTHVSCFNGNNGSITVTNANGTAPFRVSRDGINFITTASLPYTFNTLEAGTYTITVIDAGECTGFVTKTINQPTALIATLGTVNNTCFGVSTGSISASVTGGSPSYNYSWTSQGGYSSSQLNINNLPAGNYNLTVTDNKGCTALLNAAVTPYSQIVVNTIVTNVLCKGEANGSINMTVTGGTGSGFTYLWNNNATTKDRSNLGTGNYSVTITDIGSGCTTSRSFTITQPAKAVNLSVTKINSTGCSLGSITLTGSGGTPFAGPNPYLFSNNGTTYQSSGTFSGVSAGTYTVWVKDANGCTKSAVVSITDNGTDQYESNNSKNQAKTIPFATTISARIATATDVADWFKFTTPPENAIYILMLNPNSTAAFTYNMYTAGNNTPALVPQPGSITSVSKSYSLSGNTTYYISVTGGLSYTCYQLAVSIPLELEFREPVYTEKNKPPIIVSESMIAKVFPNPHQGNFTLEVQSPENGMASIELLSADGRLISVKNVMLYKGKANTVAFNNIRDAVLIYRVRLGKHTASGKIIGPN